MNLLKVIKDVLFNPIYFFENVRKQKGIKIAFLYLTILALIAVILVQTVGRFLQSYTYIIVSKIYGFSFPKPQYTFGILILMSVAGYLFTLLSSFIIAGLLHIWILIFGGKADYTKTYQLYVYSLTPRFLFGWIPFISYLAWFYYIILLIVGTQQLHGISKTRAILMYFIPVGILIIIYLVMFGFSMAMFKTVGPSILKNLTMPRT